jgi:hypothetical protein
MGLHLGWIPNEPGLRARDYDQAAPRLPELDAAKVAALRWAQHHRTIWTRLLIFLGLIALVLFGLLGALLQLDWAWGAAALLAACCWWPAVQLGWRRRRAAARLRRETQDQAARHSAEVAEYERAKAEWAESEAERVAAAPRWLQVAAHEDISRLDVFGGTAIGRRGMLTGLGWELLAERAVIVLDLSQDRVAGGLIAAAERAGLSCRDYDLPADLTATPLLDGMAGDEIASLIVEVVHADDANATAAGRATDLMTLKKVVRVLGDDVTMGRLHAALESLLAGHRDGAAGDGLLTEDERAALGESFGDGLRVQVAANLVRLAAVVEPLAGLGTAAAAPRSPARLTCLSLADGPRDVAADLTAALVVQWVTRAVAAGDGFRPAVVLAGADEQSARHLSRLTAVCERYEVPLVRTFSRLTEESARHLDTRHTAFMRLATRPEALRAAEHIGLERRFVAGRFSRTHSLSRSRTRTTSESVTHTSGTTTGEAVTHTSGTTTGQAYSEAEVPRRDQQVHVHLHPGKGDQPGKSDHPGKTGKAGQDGDRRDTPGADGKRFPGAKDGDREFKDSKNGKENKDDKKELKDLKGQPDRKGDKDRGKKPVLDIIRTRTTFSAQHESEAKTESWSKTEETSHTRSTSLSRTDGVSVGDEISFELVYDHKVQPETLMALPEDQMLAPHITERATASAAPLTDSKLVALVIDPAVVGSAAVAPVRPDEIPAFEPPAPAVSGHVPDYDRVPRPAVTAG